MSNPLATINLVIFNGEKYIRHCLDCVRAQTYENIKVNILDNASRDKTKEIIKSEYPEFNLVENKENIGLTKGMEYLLERHPEAEYFVFLCVDVLMEPDFVRKAVDIMERNESIGALQGKILSYRLENGKVVKSNKIDTCGFKIFASRRLINIGHGEEDGGQYDRAGEVFSFEGAVPVFRVRALKDAKMKNGEIWDHDFFWYGEDIDLGWRMRLFGWPSYYDPGLVAYHDRQTSKTVKKNIFEYANFSRQKARKEIPVFKRRLDWRNYRFTLIKNDAFTDMLPRLGREIAVAGYSFLFEAPVLLEIFRVIKKYPSMIRKRNEIKEKTVVGDKEMRKWFQKDVYVI